MTQELDDIRQRLEADEANVSNPYALKEQTLRRLLIHSIDDRRKLLEKIIEFDALLLEARVAIVTERKALVAALHKYAVHTAMCGWPLNNTGGEGGCRCGLSALRKRIENHE